MKKEYSANIKGCHLKLFLAVDVSRWHSMLIGEKLNINLNTLVQTISSLVKIYIWQIVSKNKDLIKVLQTKNDMCQEKKYLNNEYRRMSSEVFLITANISRWHKVFWLNKYFFLKQVLHSVAFNRCFDALTVSVVL